MTTEAINQNAEVLDLEPSLQVPGGNIPESAPNPGIGARMPFVLQAGNNPFDAGKGDRLEDIPGLKPRTVPEVKSGLFDRSLLINCHAVFRKARGEDNRGPGADGVDQAMGWGRNLALASVSAFSLMFAACGGGGSPPDPTVSVDPALPVPEAKKASVQDIAAAIDQGGEEGLAYLKAHYKDVDPNAVVDNEKNSFLMHASGKPEIQKYLLSQDADVGHQNRWGENAVSLALARKQSEILSGVKSKPSQSDAFDRMWPLLIDGKGFNPNQLINYDQNRTLEPGTISFRIANAPILLSALTEKPLTVDTKMFVDALLERGANRVITVYDNDGAVLDSYVLRKLMSKTDVAEYDSCRDISGSGSC